MTTLRDEQYVSEALEALEKVKTDAGLSAWDEAWCSGGEYLYLPEKSVRTLEDAYDRRLRWVCGVGA